MRNAGRLACNQAFRLHGKGEKMQRHFLKKAAWAVSVASAGLAGLVAPSFADVAQGVLSVQQKGSAAT